MDEQEMQFADPAWRPAHERESGAATQGYEPYVPLPVNQPADNHEQWQSAPAQEQSPDETSYAGYRGYQAPPFQTYVRPQPRRHNPFIWLIVAFVLIMLMGGGFRMSLDHHRPFDGPGYMRPYEQPAQQFQVGLHPTLVINNPYGSVHVQAGGPANFVTLQTHQEGRGDVSPSISSSDNNNTLTISADSRGDDSQVDLDVTVANDADLTIQTNDADIEVEGVNGQLSLSSDSGSISVSQVTLEGKSSLQNNSGSISFDGSLAPDGTYRFQANSGDIDVTLPSDASFHADVTTNSQSFNSDFPEVQIQPPDTQSTHGDVGNPPRPTVTISTDSGSIDLHKES